MEYSPDDIEKHLRQGDKMDSRVGSLEGRMDNLHRQVTVVCHKVDQILSQNTEQTSLLEEARRARVRREMEQEQQADRISLASVSKLHADTMNARFLAVAAILAPIISIVTTLLLRK